MCYQMNRFEKMAEEKRKQRKEKEISILIKDQPEILVETNSDSTLILQDQPVTNRRKQEI